MAPKDEVTPARWDSLHELLARAQQHKLSVTVNIHGVPSEELFDWLQVGLLDRIEQGAGSGEHRNPPTGALESGSWGEGKAEVSAFMENAIERDRRIRREEDARLEEVRRELGLDEEDEEEVAQS